MLFRFASALAAGALIATLATGLASAHEGHDHDAPAAAAGPANVAARGEAASENFELVAVAQGAELLIYLDRFATNAPITGATIEVETPTGPAKADERDDGTYRLPAPWLANAGHLDLIFTVSADNTVDILPLAIDAPASNAAGASDVHSLVERARALLSPATIGALLVGILIGVVVTSVGRSRSSVAVLMFGAVLIVASAPALAHEGHSHDEAEKSVALPMTGERAARLPSGTIFIPKPVQRIFGLRTELTETRNFKQAIELPGRVIPDPNASGFVQAAVGGRLAPPTGGFPQLGTPVKQGDVLAYVTQPMQAIDISDMRQRQGELDQQISIVERRLARYETLVPSGAIARTQLEDTRTELQGLKDRRGSLDKSRREPEELIAPVDGIIAEGTAVAGQIAQSNAVIFHIVDPSRLWVEALSFDSLPGVQSAVARLNNDRTYPLSFRGAGFAGRNQSIPVQFAVQGDVAGLRAGQFVTVLATTNEQKTGFAVPRASLVRNANGQDVVYEHVTAERFEPRPVRVEPLDGDRVFIATGLTAGRRLVVQGAELLGQVR